jgi:hypothetical protein
MKVDRAFGSIGLLDRSHFWIELSAIGVRMSIGLSRAGKMPTPQENPLFVEQASCLFIKIIKLSKVLSLRGTLAKRSEGKQSQGF